QVAEHGHQLRTGPRAIHRACADSKSHPRARGPGLGFGAGRRWRAVRPEGRRRNRGSGEAGLRGASGLARLRVVSTSASTTASAGISRREIQFQLHEWLGVERFAERPRYDGQARELYDEVLELSERMASERFAPHNALADANEPHIG